MFPFAIVSSLLLASQVAAVATPSPPTLGLSVRQTTIPTPTVPSQCQSACQNLLNLPTTCASGGIDCFCSDSSGQAFVSCGNCIVGLSGVTDAMRSAEQQSLDSMTSTCQEAGHPFSSPLKLSAKGSGALAISPSRALAALGVVAGLVVVRL